MSTTASLWQRVGNVFRNPSQTLNGDGAALHIEPLQNPDPSTAGQPRPSLWPWRRSRERVERRQQQVAELMDTLVAHFERQDQRSAEMTAAIRELGQVLQQLATTQGAQAQHVASIAGHADHLARQSAALEALLGELPAAAQAQAEAVRSVAGELRSSREAGTRLVESLGHVGRAADTLERCGTTQSETIRHIHEAASQQSAALQQFVAQQSRRLLAVTVALGIIALAIIAGLGAALFLITR